MSDRAQEALAQAVDAAQDAPGTGFRTPVGDWELDPDAFATAILDALPGWRFMSGGDFMEALDDANDTGAQQERERLRAKVEAEFATWDGEHDLDEGGEWCLSKGTILALLADPDRETS